LIRSRAIPISLAIALTLSAVAAAAFARDDAGDFIKRGKRALEEGRVAEADSSFAQAIQIARGDDLSEALFRRAGVVRSGRDAESLYRRLIDTDPESDYAERAQLELAKIQFAAGRYEGAYATLHESNACDDTEEACLFEGMAALILHRYGEASTALARVNRGSDRVWAALTLAEATDGAGNPERACAQYESLARARVSPAAWYRHAECLEKSGSKEAARKEYVALAEAFPQTPEAVRAGEKLSIPAQASASTTTPPVSPPADVDAKPRGAGYTIQFGSFGERANAIKLAAEIKKVQPAVRIDSELVNFREVFRVRVGFYATREAAESAAAGISKSLDEPYTIMPVGASP
jgi:tetratricopeptide (TPR) repeat protein